MAKLTEKQLDELEARYFRAFEAYERAPEGRRPYWLARMVALDKRLLAAGRGWGSQG